MTSSKHYHLLDRFIAILLLLISLPISIITYVIIKLSNIKLPAICKLKRYGKDKKPFYLYKFRTFKLIKTKDNTFVSEERVRSKESPMGRDKNDPRLTRFGKFIRKFSIDEIPNLVNILKGDLKFIGVRPCEEEEIQYLPPERFNHLPGFTGITSREGNKNPTLQEQYEAELQFSTLYNRQEKWKAFKNALKVMWNNK